jgi:intraflagellar transport protein 81
MTETGNNREVQFIVTTLNQSPFNKGLTLVTFDKKTAGELAQILQDVVEEITIDQKVNLREETPEMTAQRIFDFLWVLKYKSSVSDP